MLHQHNQQAMPFVENILPAPTSWHIQACPNKWPHAFPCLTTPNALACYRPILWARLLGYIIACTSFSLTDPLGFGGKTRPTSYPGQTVWHVYTSQKKKQSNATNQLASFLGHIMEWDTTLKPKQVALFLRVYIDQQKQDNYLLPQY